MPLKMYTDWIRKNVWTNSKFWVGWIGDGRNLNRVSNLAKSIIFELVGLTRPKNVNHQLNLGIGFSKNSISS